MKRMAMMMITYDGSDEFSVPILKKRVALGMKRLWNWSHIVAPWGFSWWIMFLRKFPTKYWAIGSVGLPNIQVQLIEQFQFSRGNSGSNMMPKSVIPQAPFSFQGSLSQLSVFRAPSCYIHVLCDSVVKSLPAVQERAGSVPKGRSSE